MFPLVANSQTLPLQKRLYYACKAWGFMKYYDNNVSNCNVNWDSVLLHVLPMIKDGTDYSSFNDALDTMLSAAGPITTAVTPFTDTLPPELKRNINFGWITDPVLRADNEAVLLTVKTTSLNSRKTAINQQMTARLRTQILSRHEFYCSFSCIDCLMLNVIYALN